MPWYLPVRCPVLWEEMRRRLRHQRGFAVIGLYGSMLVMILLIITAATPPEANPRAWPAFGRHLWQVFLIGQLLITLLISPGLTASVISGERESGTLSLLFLTPLHTTALVVEKFLGAIVQMVVVILSGLPVIAVVFFFGGVAPDEVLSGYALIVATGLLYSALGLLASCLFTRVPVAVAWAYGFLLIVLIGIPVTITILGLILYDAWNSLLWIPAATNPLIYLLPDSFTEWTRWHGAAAMTAITAVLLCGCTLLVRRLRGCAFYPRRPVSREVARYLSRSLPAEEEAEANAPW